MFKLKILQISITKIWKVYSLHSTLKNLKEITFYIYDDENTLLVFVVYEMY